MQLDILGTHHAAVSSDGLDMLFSYRKPVAIAIHGQDSVMALTDMGNVIAKHVVVWALKMGKPVKWVNELPVCVIVAK